MVFDDGSVEYFVDNNFSHVVKELAVVSVGAPLLVSHYLVKPPYPWSELSKTAQEQNAIQTLSHSG